MMLVAIPLVSYLMMLPIVVIIMSLGYNKEVINPMYIWIICIIVNTILYIIFKIRRNK